ncbi:MAG TPA: tetratricopeptide repeat protein, partial [Herpetosiphonaceae bacterium]
AELHARHAAFYAAFLLQRGPLLRGDNQKAALEQIAEEFENIRAAWGWAADHGAVELLGQAMEPLYRFYEMRGWVREGEQAFDRAVTGLRSAPIAGDGDLALARLLGYQGELAQRTGGYATARAALDESVALARRQGGREERAFGLCILGDIDRIQGDYDSARRRLKESHALFQILGNRPGMARALNNQGIVAGSQGQWAEAGDFFRRAIAIYQEFGEQRGIAKALNNLGIIAYMDGDHEGASQLYGRSRAIYEELGDKIGLASSLNNLAIVAKELRRYDEARDLNRRSLAMFREIGYQLGVMQVLKDLGDVAAAQGADDEARDYFLQGLRTALRMGVLPVALAMLVSLAPLLIARGRRHAALAGLALATCHAAADGETRRRAEELLAEIAPAFDPALIAQLRAEPPALEQVAAEIDA